MSADNTFLKYVVTEEEKHLEKWIKLAESHKALCPNFTYTLAGRRPLIRQTHQTTTVTTTTTNTTTFMHSGTTSTAVSSSNMGKVSTDHQPKKVVRKLRKIIDIMNLNEGDVFTTETHATPKASFTATQELLMDMTPNGNLYVTSTEVGRVTMETNNLAIYSTGATGRNTTPQEIYSNGAPESAPVTSATTSAIHKTNVLVEKLDSILNNVSHSTAPRFYNSCQSSSYVSTPPATSYIIPSTDADTTNIYDQLSIALPGNSSNTFPLQPNNSVYQTTSLTYQDLTNEPNSLQSPNCQRSTRMSETDSNMFHVPQNFQQSIPTFSPNVASTTQSPAAHSPMVSSKPDLSIIPDWEILEPPQAQNSEKSAPGKRSASKTTKGVRKKRSKGLMESNYNGQVDARFRDTDQGLFFVNVGEHALHNVMADTMTDSQEAAEAINNIKAQLIQGSPEDGMLAHNNNYMLPVGSNVVVGDQELHQIIAGSMLVTNGPDWV